MYVVVDNTPGYLPDSDPADFTNLRDARSFAASIASEYREDGNKVSKFSGSRWTEYHVEDGSLGRVISVEYVPSV